ISDLAGQPITLLDIAGLFGEVDPGMIEAIADIITLINSIPTNVGENVILPFGSVVLVGNSGPGASNFNLFDDNAMDDVRDPNKPLTDAAGGFGSAISGFTTPDGTGKTGIDKALAANSGSIPSGVSDFTSDLGKGNFGDFIDFPFL